MQSKIIFITIGYIEWRKGQDLLVDAIELLPEDVRDKSEFVLVGNNTSHMAYEIAKKVEKLNCIKMVGSVSREEIHDYLDNSDIMICPSRGDPMPTVCAEAMMHKVPCLVSDVIGTASYIRDGYDGMIFKSENVHELSNKINWCIENILEVRKMGDRAYNIFLRIFSMDVFETSLLSNIEDMMGAF